MTEPGSRRLRVLLWHVHGSWTDAFVRGRHQYLLPVSPEGAPWGLGKAGRDWPSVTEVPLDRLAEAEPDVVVVQRPEELDLVARLGVPAVYVEHNAPRPYAASSEHPLSARADITVAHVTHFNEAMWDCGRAPTTVVPHGIPDPGARYTGELAAGVSMINEPVRRRRVTGADLLETLAEAAPIDLFGMGTEEVGGRGDVPAPALHDEIARRRVYLHTARWTSLGLSLLEAMHLAMPVVVFASTEAIEAVPPDAGVLSTDVSVLARGFRELVHEPDFAALAGKNAREHALKKHGLDAFLTTWDHLLAETAR
ncbi:Glycosyl transferases group 1 [Amycolatopsis pretoriensis]|uniref:Glycosyl transferases group 1 n=1 Tax=Amycolatopsis pretoriensis TaxID=218821 RepID=A0A1H5Q4C8_9PSEU|nr:glycosyltransferase [Amycolatopsis pretoriensis]SEF20982.1 Glycosyl transferases group 1 [Amycolatopsis pretoriensis]